jgi:NAD+ diphosphatase
MEPAYLDFVPGLSPCCPQSPEDLCLIFTNNSVLLTAGGQIPIRKQVEPLLQSERPLEYLGAFRGTACYYGDITPLDSYTHEFKTTDFRTILRDMETPVFYLCCRALHLLSWHKRHGYCGSCGQSLVNKMDELARQCPSCGSIVYPRISPAVIVAVVRENTILLARNKLSRHPFHSVLAGFVEPGETLEACARREVFEEARIEIKNIRYFGSQPWPFPDSLMVGFTAEYAGGTLQIDEKELETAAWFSADDLPRIPAAPSLSRKLIEWFIENHSSNT